MLPKKKRLNKKDFSSKRKVFFRGELCDIATLELSPQKFSCIVSKKVHKHAVVRNRLRRRVYYVLQKLLQEKKLPTTASFCIYPKQKAITKTSKEYYNELLQGFATLQ